MIVLATGSINRPDLLASHARMVLEQNVFVESVLPAQIRRQLSDEEMGHYRQPFVVKRRTLMYRSV